MSQRLTPSRRPLFTRQPHRLAAAFLALLGGQLAAQPLPVVPDPGVVLNEQLRRLGNAAPRPRIDTDPAEPRVASPDAPAVRATVSFQAIEFSRTELLDPNDLRALAERYVGRPLTTDDLQALLDGISALYQAKEVLTAAAVLPQQDLQSGRLRVLLVEGKLGRVRVQGDDTLDTQWVQSWFNLPQGEVVRGDAVRDRLVVFNAASDRSAAAAFEAGETFGVTDLVLDVPATPRWQFWSFVESTQGQDATGLQSAIGLRWAPLGMRGGRLESALLSSAAGKTLSLSGSLPLGHEGWRTGANLATSRSKTVLVGQNDQPLTLDGQSNSWGLDLSRTVAMGGPWLGVFGAQLGQMHSSTSIGETSVFDRRVNRAQLSANLSRDTANGRSVVRAQWVNASSRGETFRYVDMGLGHLQSLGESKRWQWRANAVLRGADSGTPLASEVLLLGGADTVRGYDAGSSSGEQGHALQLELRYRAVAEATKTVDVFAFWDQGRAKHSNSAAVPLESVGLGLQARLNASLGMELTASHQRKERGGSPNRLTLRLLASW